MKFVAYCGFLRLLAARYNWCQGPAVEKHCLRRQRNKRKVKEQHKRFTTCTRQTNGECFGFHNNLEMSWTLKALLARPGEDNINRNSIAFQSSDMKRIKVKKRQRFWLGWITFRFCKSKKSVDQVNSFQKLNDVSVHTHLLKLMHYYQIPKHSQASAVI